MVIGVVIAIAIAAGVYAISGPQNEVPSAEISLQDDVQEKIKPPEEKTEVIDESEEEAKLGLKDEADASINPPEEEADASTSPPEEEQPSVIQETVEEQAGIKAKQGP